MRYVPYGNQLRAVGHLIVDSYGPFPDCLLELSHWPGNRTPREYRQDTSTESVLAWVDDGCPVREGRHLVAVSNDHYDLDGLLAMWAAIYPQRALDHGRLLVNIATTEDFDRFVDEPSLRICLELLAIEKAIAREINRAHVSDPSDFTQRLYESMLPEVLPCLEGPPRLEAEWRADLACILRSLEDLAAATPIAEFPEADLAAVIGGPALHPFALHAATTRGRVLRIADGERPQILYRYESFVEYVSRPLRPRVPLKPLAHLLNRHERRGVWRAEGMLQAHPRVQLFGGDGSVVASSQPVEAIVKLVLDYFRAADCDPSLGWRPSDGLRPDAERDVLPPSMQVIMG